MDHIESYPHVGLTIALGKALVAAKRPLVYGGGSNGIMGIVSGAVLSEGGDAVGVIPHAMLAKGEGERGESSPSVFIKLKEEGRERMEWVRLVMAPVSDPDVY